MTIGDSYLIRTWSPGDRVYHSYILRFEERAHYMMYQPFIVTGTWNITSDKNSLLGMTRIPIKGAEKVMLLSVSMAKARMFVNVLDSLLFVHTNRNINSDMGYVWHQTNRVFYRDVLSDDSDNRFAPLYYDGSSINSSVALLHDNAITPATGDLRIAFGLRAYGYQTSIDGVHEVKIKLVVGT